MKIFDILLNRPKSWEDNNLYNVILPYEQAFEVEVLSIDSKKITKVKLYLKNVKRVVNAIFFKFTNWHKINFKVGKHLYIRGVLENNQIVHPKIISFVGKIVPIYKNPSIKKELKKISLPIPLLPKSIGETLYYMHFPRSLSDIQEDKVNYALKFAEIFLYLYKMESKKITFPAIESIQADYSEFIANLPFSLTEDQLKTIEEIKKDINSQVQARRVIIGDVGSGKTIVMLATAFMSKKAIIMCPTSILANQIYEEAKKFLPNFKTYLITQKSKFTEDNLKNYNLLIGTHAILYQNISPANTIMIDEQHRFGVNQRDELEKKCMIDNKRPHAFQFSATPIPRTQALIMSSFVNVSLIKQLPFKKDIVTKLIYKEDLQELMAHIKNEISKGKQVIIVYPLVEESQSLEYKSIESAKDFWLKNFNNVYITHGKDKNKEDVLVEFREKGSILVTTTVIEVGISLPKLSTIVIVGAERLGLATLHQLRGRVGRYGERGYCFLYTKDKNSKRLNQFSKTLDGFKIAQMDLEFRKSGDIFDGTKQSGEIFQYFDESKDEKILEQAKEYLISLNLK